MGRVTEMFDYLNTKGTKEYIHYDVTPKAISNVAVSDSLPNKSLSQKINNTTNGKCVFSPHYS